MKQFKQKGVKYEDRYKQNSRKSEIYLAKT